MRFIAIASVAAAAFSALVQASPAPIPEPNCLAIPEWVVSWCPVSVQQIARQFIYDMELTVWSIAAVITTHAVPVRAGELP